MRIGYGLGGWCRVDDEDLPGPLYVRIRKVDGALHVTELYLDGRDKPITGQMLRTLPLSRLRAVLLEGQGGAILRHGLDVAGPALSVLASYFSTSFSDPAAPGQRKDRKLNWVAQAWLSQYKESSVDEVKRHADPRGVEYPEQPPLTAPEAGEGLTDEFLSRVAAAYYSKLAQGVKNPAKVLSEEVGHATARTVHRWIYLARQRGLMEKTTRGQVG